MALDPDTTVSHYRILSKIGEGGMGEVYLAEDKVLERKVALKIISEECCRESDRLQRFIREAKASSALNHPNIITIFEFGTSENTHFIASEFIEGRTLGAILDEGPLSVPEAISVANQVASALSAAHAAGIVHRDIKPDNVMVRPDGIVKVLDFGVAKLLRFAGAERTDPEGETKVKIDTSPGMIIGTASYMSPEQAAGREVDHRSDIFSFGILLYEMLAGSLPFEGDSAVEVLGSILYKDPIPLGKTAPHLPDELCKVISRAIEKDPGDRYQDISEFIEDVRRLTGESAPVEIRGTGFARQNEAATRILEAPSTGDVPGGTTWGTGTFRPLNARYLFGAAVVVLLGLTAAAFWYFRGGGNDQIDTVAVLPFTSDRKGEEAESVSDGLTESLISGLSRIPGLTVRARSSVFRFKGPEADPKKAAAELNVRAVVTGRLSHDGDQMSLYVEVIDMLFDKVIWSEQFTGPQSGMAGMRSDIVRRVSDTLRGGLPDDQMESAARSGTADADAFKLYLKARYFWNKRTGEALLTAEDLYKQAIEKDPAYAQAYAGLAETYAIQHFYSVADPGKSMPKAAAAARKALEIDETLAEAHAAMGLYLLHYKWDLEASERELRKAIELNPNYATGHHWLGNGPLVALGRFDEAIAAGEKAEELDPLSSIVVTDTGWNLLFARRYDQALKKLSKAEELDPNFFYTIYTEGLVYYLTGRYPEAIAKFRRTLELEPDPFTKSMLACSLIKSGERQEGLRLLEELKSDKSGRYIPNSGFALIYGVLGDMDKAIDFFDKDLADRADNPFGRAIDPLFDDLRKDPRFGETIDKYKRMAPLS